VTPENNPITNKKKRACFQALFSFLLKKYKLKLMKKNKIHKPLPVCAILWQDAAYSYEKEAPIKLPPPQLTFGFVIATSNKHTNITSSVSYDKNTGKFYPADGFVIPKQTTLEFKKIGWFGPQKKHRKIKL